MEGEEFTMIEMAIIAAMLLLGCTEINKRIGLEDDNFAEEIIEVVIMSKTGLDIDLTPESEEHGL